MSSPVQGRAMNSACLGMRAGSGAARPDTIRIGNCGRASATERPAPCGELVWALLTSAEFRFNH